MTDDLVVPAEKLERLTGYKRPGEQLRELHRQGFHRARRVRDGSLVLEWAHYHAVCAGGTSTREPELRP